MTSRPKCMYVCYVNKTERFPQGNSGHLRENYAPVVIFSSIILAFESPLTAPCLEHFCSRITGLWFSNREYKSAASFIMSTLCYLPKLRLLLLDFLHKKLFSFKFFMTIFFFFFFNFNRIRFHWITTLSHI